MPEYVLGYEECRRVLLDRLAEPSPGRLQLVTGPRQVGKTTLLLDLARTYGEAAVYAAGDDPDASLPGFWERAWTSAIERTRRGTAILLLDEVHHFADWSRRLKGEWDRLRRHRAPIHVVATGSSALRIGVGSRESLAGRFERLTLSHWSAASISQVFQLAPDEAASVAVEVGTYPGAFALRHDVRRWRAYIRESIVEPAIGRDVLATGAVRRPGLLRQVFWVAAASPGQIVSLQKLQGQLQDRSALETVAHYLSLLEEAYLIAPLEKFAARAHRRRSAPPKLVALNNALISAVHPEGPPDSTREPARFGAWVENACLAFAVNSGQRVAYWREEPLELDAVLDGSWGTWAVEIKTGRFEMAELRGVLEFSRRHPRYRPLILTAPGDEPLAERHGLAAVSWRHFLVSGPPPRR